MGFWNTVRRWLVAEGEAKGLTINRSGYVDDGTGFIPQSVAQQAMMYGGSHGLDSNVVMAPVMWIMRTFTEAVCRVQRKRPDEIWEFADHDAESLIDQPNGYYDGDSLWKATVISYALDGNAYWQKVRNQFGDVIALWYLPHWLVNPVYPTDGSRFIDYYDLHGMGAQPVRILPRDIVHFRFGLDPRNPRLGLSPLRTVLQEVFTDDEAAAFSSQILTNMGVPGLIVSPKVEMIAGPPGDLEKVKNYWEGAFSGAKRGKVLVTTKPTDVHQFGFDPAKLTLGNLRDISEERVCAALSVPAAVVGFGSGLQSTTVGATMQTLVRQAWVVCIKPMQRSMSRQLTAQLLPDFVAQTRRFRFQFDTAEAASFQEEDDLRAKRSAILVQAGIMSVNEAREINGLPIDTRRKVYLQPSNAIPIGEDGTVAEEMMPAKPEIEEPGTPMADPTDERTGPVDEDTKLLAAIAERHGFTNGNGTHTETS